MKRQKKMKAIVTIVSSFAGVATAAPDGVMEHTPIRAGSSAAPFLSQGSQRGGAISRSPNSGPRHPDRALFGDGDMSSPGRSLALVQADPGVSRNQSIIEVTGGVHSYEVCDADEGTMSLGTNLWFCDFRDEPITFVVWPDWITDQEKVGVTEYCPSTKEGCLNLNLTGLSLENCLKQCGNAALDGEECSDEVLCTNGTFCKRMPGEGRGGTCSACPSNPQDCLADSIGTDASKKSCLECDLECSYYYWGDFTVEGEKIWAYALDSRVFYSTPGSAVGPLEDCSDLVLESVDTCPGAEGSICLIHYYVWDSFFHELARKCEDSGGLAMVLYHRLSNADIEEVPDHLPGYNFLLSKANIPVVRIAYNEGVALRENRLGSLANVTTYDAGTDCWVDQYCSVEVPCFDDDKYCVLSEDVDVDEGLWCYDCPEDPIDCFFQTTRTPLPQREVESCASKCGKDFGFGTWCKTCGETMSAFEFGVDDPADRCNFCPEEDMAHPDRALPFFSSGGTEVKCWQVQAFFKRVDVPKDSKNCKLAQLQDYICGCEGSGHAGANTQAKQNALVWVPRSMAILSGLGSLFVLVDTLRVLARRSSMFHQLMVQMSLFDIIGSIAYAFTSLPIPSTYYFQGARGNEATCTAQGFFIQVGTVACFTNVSLALYYFFVIQRGVSESSIKDVSLWFFICPVVVGMTFAFAGKYCFDSSQAFLVNLFACSYVPCNDRYSILWQHDPVVQ
ncbi:hypothetical protein ACHAWF_008351 [Thalassiosira exigua]